MIFPPNNRQCGIVCLPAAFCPIKHHDNFRWSFLLSRLPNLSSSKGIELQQYDCSSSTKSQSSDWMPVSLVRAQFHSQHKPAVFVFTDHGTAKRNPQSHYEHLKGPGPIVYAVPADRRLNSDIDIYDWQASTLRRTFPGARHGEINPPTNVCMCVCVLWFSKLWLKSISVPYMTAVAQLNAVHIPAMSKAAT